MVHARNLCVVVIDFYELLRKMGLSFFLKTRFGSSYPSRWTSSCFLQKFQELFWKATANKGVLLLVLVMVLCLNLFQVFRVLFIYLFLFIICRRWVKISSFLLRCKTHAQPSSRTHALHVRIRIQTRTSAQTHIARTHASHSRRTRTHIYTHARTNTAFSFSDHACNWSLSSLILNIKQRSEFLVITLVLFGISGNSLEGHSAVGQPVPPVSRSIMPHFFSGIFPLVRFCFY